MAKLARDYHEQLQSEGLATDEAQQAAEGLSPVSRRFDPEPVDSCDENMFQNRAQHSRL